MIDRASDPLPNTRPSMYLIAVAVVAAAAVIRWLLSPVLGDAIPYVTFFPAVAIAAWQGGLRPALLATLLSVLLVWLLFLPPYLSFEVEQASGTMGLIVFVVMGITIAGFSGMLHEALNRSRRAEDAASQQAEFLRTTLSSIGDAVISTDVDGRIISLNGAAESLTGWANQEAAGRNLEEVFRIVSEDTRRSVPNPAVRAIQEGAVARVAEHTILIGKDGSEHPIDDSAAPIRTRDGQIVGCVLVFRNVSQRRGLERGITSQLMAAKSLAAIVESSDDAIISKSLDGIIQSWNAAAERIFGYTAEQAVGRHISMLIPRDRASEEDRIIAQLKAGKRIDHYETLRVRRDGRILQVSLTISPLKDEAGQVVGASKIARDISERKQAEQERQKFVTLVENSTDFIGICDVQGVPSFVNRAGLAMVGLASIEEAREHAVWDFFFPEDQTEIRDKFFPSVLASGHGEIEVRFRHFKTGEAVWMVYKVLALSNSDGEVLGFATVSQNVTERRRLEDHLRKLAADLVDAGRRKDEFLATLAHELRNPLAPIRNAVQIIRLSDDRKVVEDARDMMERQLDQMVRLVDDLLDVSRITRGKLELRKEQVLLSSVLESAVETSRPWIDYMGHALEVSLPAEPIIVNADMTRLAQVFANLLNNSAKYTPRGGRIWLSAERQGNEAVVSVKDTGVGIAPENLTRIFEMFSQVDASLDRSQGGLGIGLTLVKRLVEMHGGAIEARSQGPGNGAEFVVRLPIVIHATKGNTEESERQELTSSLRILIVDDNRDSAHSLALLLGLQGNDTRTAYDGQQAVELGEEFRPDVILLDIGLPKLNGYEACQRIRQTAWGKNALLIAVTGWGQEEDRRRSRDAGFDHHMTKPIVPQVLMNLLADLQVSKA